MTHLNLINDYTWRLLKQEQGWTPISGAVPLIPVRERPEFDQQNKPYIVFAGSRETGRSTLPNVRLATAQYVIYSGNREKTDTVPARSKENIVNDAVRILEDAFGSWEESADKINASAYHAQNNRRNYLSGVSIKWTQVTNTEYADPGDSEGGKATGFIQIRYSYTEDPQTYEILY